MRRLVNGDGKPIIVYEYPHDKFKGYRAMSSGGYLNIYGTFDIETTVINIADRNHAIMYIWQFAIGAPNGVLDVYTGRTWRDYQNFLLDLKRYYRLDRNKKLIIWVHFLAYEFEWLRSLGNVTRMFAVKKRAPVVVEFDDVFEYRCSYRLSNMSLAKFAETECAEHQKQDGEEFNYLVKRYPDTCLSDAELMYCVCDVLSLHESVAHLNAAYGDTLRTMPYTSTGYVRREARERVQTNLHNRYAMIDKRLSAHLYKLCKSAARGGNTHANVLYVGDIIDNVRSKDKSSSYPYQMLAQLYPSGKFIEEKSDKIIADAANIMLLVMYDVRLKAGVYMPYISYSKCERLGAADFAESRFDNGRVIKAPRLIMSLTEIDYNIIMSQYDIGKIDVLEHWVAGYGYLNQEYRNYIYECYKAKCELKGKDEYFYSKYKNKVNALFGMMLTDITREEITYINNEWGSYLPPVFKALNEYYANRKSFLSYQDGIYVTAWARAELQKGLDAVGIDGIYCDTDSVKYIGRHESDFELINRDIRAKSALAGIKPVTVNGKVYELGVWEDDADYARFITHGAKKYAYEYSNSKINGKHAGEIGVTVSGLSKSKGKRYLEDHGGLEAFTVGAIWDTGYSGRMTATYNDEIMLKDIIIDGHKCELTSNVALVPTTYELSYTEDYAELVELKTLG